MSLPYRERRTLRGIEAGICCSEPILASMMALFSRLAADEDMPRHERGPRAIVRLWAVTLAICAAIVHVGARVMGACLRVFTATDLGPGRYGSQVGAYQTRQAYMPWYWYR